MRSGETDRTPAVPAAHFHLLLLALLAGVLLAALDGTIVAVALPTIVGDLGSVEDTHWVLTAYLLTATASTLLYGRLSDLLGRRPVFLAAVVIFLLGSALCGAAQGMGTLAAARALQGLGGGGLLAVALAIVADLVPAGSRARYHGLFGAVYGLASVLGPVLAGPIVDHAGWRWLFYLNLPVGAAVVLVVLRVLPAGTRRDQVRLDLRGAALLAGAVGFFLCWITRGQEVGFGDAGSASLGIIAAALTATFLLAQHQATEPVLPLALFRIRAFALVSAMAFCAGAALFAAILYIPLTLQLVQSRSASSSGLILAAMTTGLLVASVGVGRLASRSGRYKGPPVLGAAAIAVAAFVLTGLDAQTPAATIIAALGLFGFGLGLISPLLVVIAQGCVDRAHLGVATAAVSFFRNLGGTVGSAAGVVILHHHLSAEADGAGSGAAAGELNLLPDRVLALPSEQREQVIAALADAAATTFWVAVGVGVLTALLAAALPRSRPAASNADAAHPADQYASPPNTKAAAPTSPAS